MPQRPVQGAIGNVRAAFLGQQQEGDHVRAGRVEVALSIAGERRATARPGIVVLGLRRAIDPLLDVRENLRVAGAQVALGERDSAIADVPRIAVSRCLARPLAHDLQILVVAGGEQKQHADSAEPLFDSGLER